MSGNLRPSKSHPQNTPHVRTRKKKMLGNRRNSVDTCSTEASSKHLSPGKDRRIRHSMPAPSSTPSASNLSSNGANWEHPAQESPRLSTTSVNHSTSFSLVSLDPPITRAVLSELAIARVEKDLVLRHHLNFDPHIEFRVNTQGPQAEERRERAHEYWHALAAEIASWLEHCQRIAACPSSRPLRTALHGPGAKIFPKGASQRLPRLFGAVRDILKHSLPSEEWPIIDARLDIQFLMQQLEHGICDFTALSDWLGNFLRRFCSPTRDRLLHTMTSAVRQGVENAEKDSIVHGLIAIFEILQGMNLVNWPRDATNHSIRSLRSAWVEDTVAFEQNDFLQRIAHGWDVIGAQMWFKNLQENEESSSGLWTLAKALTDAVVFSHNHFPPTLTLDYNRLRILQVDFAALVYQAACRQTFEKTLKSLGWTGQILARSYTDLFHRVSILISDQELQDDYWQRRGPVALEVVRAAYTVCSNRKVPTSENLKIAEDCLRHCCDSRAPIFEYLRSTLAKELKDKVGGEVCAINDLTPLQLMIRSFPKKPECAVQSEHEGLIRIAKRVSHIAELHWRIWGPILYEQPMHVGGRALGNTFLIEEGRHSQGSSPFGRTNESGRSPRNTGWGA